MSKKHVTLFFRRPHATGSFSIEAYFERMMHCFPAGNGLSLRRITSSYFSIGVVPRLRGLCEAGRHAGDVNHVTGDVHYLALGLPGRRTVLTIHDCGFMSHPNPVMRRLLQWFWLDLPVRHCHYITAVSEATRRDIIRYTGCSPRKVVVIPTVIPDGFVPVEKPFNAACPRILHVGLAPNKNFARHVEAIAGLTCELHIIGRLQEWHVRLLERHGIRYTCEYNISASDMRRAYAESDLLLFASTLEGFGMPIIEAQTTGRPVVTSNCSSMPEAAGAGACLVDPLDVDSIRAGVRRVLEDAAYRAGLVEAGHRNVQRFSAEAVARQYERLYQRVATQ